MRENKRPFFRSCSHSSPMGSGRCGWRTWPLVASVILSAVAVWMAYYSVFVLEPPNYCTMTYMNSRLLPLPLNNVSRLESKYTLYLYREGPIYETVDKMVHNPFLTCLSCHLAPLDCSFILISQSFPLFLLYIFCLFHVRCVLRTFLKEPLRPSFFSLIAPFPTAYPVIPSPYFLSIVYRQILKH
jgi:hypothetical protein